MPRRCPRLPNTTDPDFRVIGYSPFKESQEIQNAFDAFEVTGNLNDAQFIDRIRHDNVDIFVELSGLSPYHRFSAMAGRCAPVQVAALNHTSTTRVPNVDYILADQIAAPNENDIYFSEEVYRLPTCFFCFDYNENTLPAINRSTVRGKWLCNIWFLWQVRQTQFRHDRSLGGCYKGGTPVKVAHSESWHVVVGRTAIFLQTIWLERRR